MDIITHALSGMMVSSTQSALPNKPSFPKQISIIASGIIGGILPDIDSLSLWPHFDKTIGKWLHLSHKGVAIYYGNYWYSHHNMFHSFVGGLLFVSLFILGFWVIKLFSTNKDNNSFNLLSKFPYLIAFYLGYLAHLAGDLPTPACVWGGIKLFWPLKISVGGSGLVWWWHNYDIFLILFFGCLLNIILILLINLTKKTRIKYFVIFIFFISISLIFYQINNRNFYFGYKGYLKKPLFAQYEKQSLFIQERILGKKTYNIMRRFNNKIKINF